MADNAPEVYEVIINGDNCVRLDGYITRKVFAPEKRKLFFNLGHVSTSVKKPGRFFEMDVPVNFFNAAAEEVAERVREGAYMTIEGKLRGYAKVIDIAECVRRGIKEVKYYEYSIIGTHVKGAENVKVKLHKEAQGNEKD